MPMNLSTNLFYNGVDFRWRREKHIDFFCKLKTLKEV